MAYCLVELEEGENVAAGTHIAVKGLLKNLDPLFGFLYLDRLISPDGYYYHHGVHLGNCRVIHFFGANKKDATPRTCNMNEFHSRGEVDGKIYRAVYNDTAVVLPFATTDALAREVLAHPKKWPKYDIKDNNCETFATCLKTGRGFSDQASNAMLYGISTIVSSCIVIVAIWYNYFK
jgi:hypothetical protein